MKVLAISEHYFPIKGGSTIYTYNITKSLSKLGWEVFLVTMPDDKNPVSKWCIEEGLQVYRLNIPRILRKERYFPFCLSLKINKILDQVNPDIAHFTYGFFAPLVTRISKKINSRPIVWTVHNVPPYEYSLEFLNLNIVHDILEKIYFGSADLYGRMALKIADFDRLICVSEKTAGLVRSRGVDTEKIEIIPNGVNIYPLPKREEICSLKKNMNIQDRYPLITTVAGIWPNKGLEYLIKSVPTVLRKYPEALFTIIGPVRSKAYYQKILAMIRELGIENNARILLGLPYEELNDFYAITDLYVQPSLEEAFCITILEAMSFGKPVVGTNTGAIPKFIHESRGGVLINSASETELSEAIIGLLEDTEEMKKMGRRSREYVVKNYSWDRIGEATSKLYKSLLK